MTPLRTALVPAGAELRLRLNHAKTHWTPYIGGSWVAQRGLHVRVFALGAESSGEVYSPLLAELGGIDQVFGLPVPPPPREWSDVPKYFPRSWVNDSGGQAALIEVGNIPGAVNRGHTWSVTVQNSGTSSIAACADPTLVDRSTIRDLACAADPCGTSVGNFWETTTDVSIEGRGPDLSVERTYDSARAERPGALGHGWRHNYEMEVEIEGALATVVQENGSIVPFVRVPDGRYATGTEHLATLTKEPDGSWVFIRRAREIFRFDPDGRLTSVEDLDGHVVTLAYAGDHLASATDASGRSLTFVHTPSGELLSVSDPVGRTVAYGQSGGDLVSVTDVGGGVTSYGYDGTHRLTSKLDPRQQGLPPGERRPVTNSYDAEGRVAWQEDRTGSRTTFSYGSWGSIRVTAITDARGTMRLDWFDAGGLRAAVTYAAGTSDQASWFYERDPVTLGVTTVRDAAGGSTTVTYDTAGNATSYVDGAGNVSTATYGSLNELLTLTDPSGVVTTMTYDTAGNLLSMSRPLTGSGQAAVVTRTYDGVAGDVTSQTDPSGAVTTFEHDARGYVTSVADAAGRSRWLYDDVGRLTAYIPPNGNATPGAWWVYARTYASDAHGNVLAESHPGLQRGSTFAYDGNGNLVAATDPEGQTTTYEYDAEDRRTAEIRPDGTRLETQFDPNGNVIALRDGAGNETVYTHDRLDRVASEQPPVVAGEPARVTRFDYDLAGRLVTEIDPVGRATSYSYDGAGRTVGIQYDDPETANVTYSYDALGRRTSMSDGSGDWVYGYDSLARLVSSSHNGTTVTYGYDLAGRRDSLTYPSGRTVSYERDGAGRVTSLSFTDGGEVTFGWDAGGNLLSQSNPNGVATTKSYSWADELIAVSHDGPAGNLMSASYEYDRNGQLTSVDPGSLFTAGSEQYGYTANGKIETVLGTPFYQHDSADNLSTQVFFSRSYDAANRLVSQTNALGGPTSFSFDANGNRTVTDPGPWFRRFHRYDQANRLVSITGSVTATYTYNGDGLRVSKTSAGSTRSHTWDLSGETPMLLSDGVREYVHGPEGLPLAHVDNATGGVVWYGSDHQGSTRLLTDDAGTIVGSYRYEPYGIELQKTGSATTPLRFAGQYTDDESGYQYLRSRYYDPATGQFLTRDPLASTTRSPYSFADGDPLRFGDRTGLSHEPHHEKSGFERYKEAGTLSNDPVERRKQLGPQSGGLTQPSGPPGPSVEDRAVDAVCWDHPLHPEVGRAFRSITGTSGWWGMAGTAKDLACSEYRYRQGLRC